MLYQSGLRLTLIIFGCLSDKQKELSTINREDYISKANKISRVDILHTVRRKDAPESTIKDKD